MRGITIALRIFALMLALVCLLALASCGEDATPDGGGDGSTEEGRHVHTFSSDWEKDETHHWHPATCDHTRHQSDYGEHTFDRGVIWQQAGCESEGILRFTCTVCGGTKDETYVAKGHAWGDFEIVTPASCTTDGERTRTCDRCGASDSEPIAKTDHKLTDNWSYNESEHWRACLCGENTEMAEHNFVSGECTVCWARQGAIVTNELLFSLSDNGQYYIVKGIGTLSDENLRAPVIPATYKGLPVTEIADGAFRGESGIYSIVIPAHITSIGAEAFFGCENLSRVSIGEGVKTIGSAAFSGCPQLTSVSVSGANTAFMSQSGCLIRIADKCLISSWGNGTIPEGVVVIGAKAFWAAEILTSLSIPRTVKTIDNFAFFGCSGLERVAIPEGVTTIGAYAFSGCSGMRAITLPATLTTLGERALSDCFALQNITLPEALKTIGAACFHGCVALTSINIPDSVTSIGYSPFSGCTGLTTITVGFNNQHYYSEGNCLMYQKNRKVSTIEDIILVAGCASSVIPSNTMIIETGAFYGITGLTSVSIPASVTRIAATAFADCTGLSSVTLGTGLVTIGDCAFGGCIAIREIFIPKNVQNMGREVFTGCVSLTTIRCAVKVVPDGWDRDWRTGCNATAIYEQNK